jgi:hypothetical protein
MEAMLGSEVEGVLRALLDMSPVHIVGATAAACAAFVSERTGGEWGGQSCRFGALDCVTSACASQQQQQPYRGRVAAAAASPHRPPPALLSPRLPPKPQLMWQVCNVSGLIKYRHLPGPAPVPVMGNLHTVALRHKKLAYKTYREWHAAYGKDFKWFAGQQPYVVTSGGGPAMGQVARAGRSHMMRGKQGGAALAAPSARAPAASSSHRQRGSPSVRPLLGRPPPPPFALPGCT